MPFNDLVRLSMMPLVKPILNSVTGEFKQMIGTDDKRDVLNIAAPSAAPIDKHSIIDARSIPQVKVADDPNYLAPGLCGVPQYNFEMCSDAAKSIAITSIVPGPGRTLITRDKIHTVVYEWN